MQPTPTRSPTLCLLTLAPTCGDFADDLVARHQRVHGDAPLVARLVDVGVADAAVEDLDGHVVRPRAAAAERHGGEGSGGGLGGVTDGCVHEEPRKNDNG